MNRPLVHAPAGGGRLGTVAGLLWLVASLAAALPAAASVRALPGGEATIGAVGDLATRDPARATTAPERLLAAATECTVTSLLDRPPAASDDGRTVTLHLAAGRVFHDGSAIDGEAVARSLAHLADPGTGAVAAWRLLVIAGVADRLAGRPAIPAIRATGPLTVVVDLAVPGVDLAARLDDPRLPVVGLDGHTGCGPFEVVRPTPAGARGVVLAPFDRAPGGRGYLDRLTLVPLAPGDDPSGLDLVVGAGAPPPTGPATEVTVLLAPGRGDAARGAALADRAARAVDPAALVRDFVGGGATAIAGVPAPDGKPAPVPGGAVDLAYDPGDPTATAVAGRIQVRLHDQGLEAALTPIPGLGPEAAAGHDLAVVTLPAVPVDPGDTRLAVATALGRPEMALKALAAPGRAGTWRALRALPLYRRPVPLTVTPRLLGVTPGSATAVSPAALWRWPLVGDPPAPPVAPAPPG